MRGASRFLAALLAVGLGRASCSLAEAGTAMPVEILADVVARVQPSVVRIVVVHPAAKAAEPDAGASDPQQSDAASAQPVSKIGSGFVIDAAGLVATNRHVVENSVSIFVSTTDGARYRAEIVGLAAKSDIALLRIDPGAKIPALPLGNSDAVRAGDTVIAIGSPFGFDNTVTAGIVSSVNRDIMESPFDDYIQTDAAINHGNSGGPLFNLAGQVVGMNSVLFAPGQGSAGVGFAIPSNELRFVLDRLRAYGDVRAGMLPIRTQQVTGLMAEAVGVPSAGGALIASLGPEADQMDGKIQPGDVVTRFNAQAVADPRDLARKAAVAAVGSKAVLSLYRAGKAMTVEVPILPLERGAQSAPSNGYHPKVLGLRFGDDRRGQAGVTLSGIDPSGSAADSGLLKGDVILRVQQQAVSTPDEASRALQARIDGKHAYAAVLVERDGKQTWFPIALPD